MINIIITECQFKSLIEQNSLNLKGKTIAPGISAKHSSNYVSKDEENLFITALNEIISLHKAMIPIHVRAFAHFLIGKTKPFTENDMTSEEKDFLKKAALDLRKSEDGDNGFSYPFWHVYTRGDSVPAGYSKNPINLINMSYAGQFFNFLGQVPLSNIKISPDKTKVTIIDNYDMNFNEGGKSKEKVMRDLETAIEHFKKNPLKTYMIIRRLGDVREFSGYNGYPVNINL